MDRTSAWEKCRVRSGRCVGSAGQSVGFGGYASGYIGNFNMLTWFNIIKVQGLPSPIHKKPYQAEPIFIILLEIFFKHMKSIGSQFPHWFLDIAKNKKSKSNDDFKFTGNQFCDNHSYHVSVLEQIQVMAPNKFHKMMSDIYKEVQCLHLDNPGPYAQDVSLTFLDINGMDDE
ncbi:hypothetical protein C8R48DRAFT_673268 [Suillus tomentosus]|nr:hypothetical protein C8R48DRAFT_673268 [Suillus tomentosus]